MAKKKINKPPKIRQWPLPGDIVSLKSGGPDMVVVALDENSNAVCRWFDAHNAMLQSNVPVVAMAIPEHVE